MADLLTLNCPTCGGSLQVTNDVERFVCAHCGNAHIIDPDIRVESLAGELERMRLLMDIREAEASLAVLQERKLTLEKVTAGQSEMRRIFLVLNIILPIGVVILGVKDGASVVFSLLLAAFLGVFLLFINLYLSMAGRNQPEQSELQRLTDDIMSGNRTLDNLRQELQGITVQR